MFAQYYLVIYAAAIAGMLFILQLIIADFAAIKSGHKAGTPIEADFSRFMFRAARAHANMNESITAFALFTFAGVFSIASPTWLGIWACLYVVSRIAHMISYYMNKKISRSTAFGISLVALTGMFITTVVSWI